MESSDSSKHYIYSYDCNSFQTHCVVKGQYLKYGVNANHQIYYSNTDYNGSYDTSLGGLYSFDEKKYIYGEENGFTPQKGNIISETLDTESYEKETKNAFLSGISIAFKDFKNIISGSVSIVKTLFDKLDAQTIFGYKIGDLKKAVSNTNEDDIATVTDKKVAIHSVDNEVPSTLNATAKWIVALCTCVVLISSIVLPLIFKATAIVLPLKVILTSLRTASIKLTLRTIVKNKNFTDVNWIYIAFSSVVSGITAIINIKKETPIAKIITKKIRKTSLKFMKEKVLSSFSLVSCLALAIHLSSTICTIYKGLLNCVSKVSPTISNKISTAIKNKTLTITNNLEDSTNESTETVVAEQTADSVEQASTDSDTVSFMTQKSIQSLPSEENSYFAITNENGDSISKAELLKNDGNGYLTLKNFSSGNKYASSFINQKGETLNRISIKNGSVQFQEINSISVSTSSWKSLIGSRTDNIKILDDSLKNMIINDSSKVSSDVRDYFTNKGVAFENLSYSDFDDMRRDLNKTWHECEDRTTGLLIDNTIHNAISHIDGYSLIKAITAYYFPGKIVLTAK